MARPRSGVTVSTVDVAADGHPEEPDEELMHGTIAWSSSGGDTPGSPRNRRLQLRRPAQQIAYGCRIRCSHRTSP
jgi:hypothetical protein